MDSVEIKTNGKIGEKYEEGFSGKTCFPGFVSFDLFIAKLECFDFFFKLLEGHVKSLPERYIF